LTTETAVCSTLIRKDPRLLGRRISALRSTKSGQDGDLTRPSLSPRRPEILSLPHLPKNRNIMKTEVTLMEIMVADARRWRILCLDRHTDVRSLEVTLLDNIGEHWRWPHGGTGQSLDYKVKTDVKT